MEVARDLLPIRGLRSQFFDDLNLSRTGVGSLSWPLVVSSVPMVCSRRCTSSQSLNLQLDSSLDDFQMVHADDVKRHMLSKRKRRLKYYTKLAGRLAEGGHAMEMADLIAMLADAGIDRLNFVNAVEMDHVHSASKAVLAGEGLDPFVAFISKLHAAGFSAFRFAGDGAMGLLSVECERLLITGQVDRCVSVLSTLSECGFPVRKLVDGKQLIATCARYHRVDSAIRYAALLPPVNLHFNHMIQEFGHHGDLEGAFTLFSSMEGAGIKPDMYTYRALIDACAYHRDTAKATSVFKEIVRSGSTPNVYVYNSLMNVHAGDTEIVWQLYEEMQDVGVEPDLATYNIMLKSCSVSKSAEKAITLYNDMEKGAATTGLKLDAFTYTTTIHIFGEAKQWELALKVKENMIAAGVSPNVITWTALLGACANAGMVEQAFNIFNEMLVAGCAPNAQTYNMLINACCESGQHDRAVQLFNEWKNTGKISAYRESRDTESGSGSRPGVVQIGELFSDEKMYEGCDDAAKISTSRPYSKPNLVTYNTLMKACSQEPSLVKEIMDSIVSAGLTPDRTSWSSLIDAYGSKGYLDEAINVFRNMREIGISPDLVAYTSIIKACVEARDADKAFEFFCELKEVGLRPNKVTYNTLFRAQRTCRKLCEVQRALALYEEMRDAGYAPNDGLLRVLLEQWAEGAIEDGGIEQRASALKYEREVSAGFSEYTQLLLQKVAVHAQEQDAEPNLIDLHGLSRGEARIAVLAVLRIIKERHSQGYPINDDLVIITGVGRHSEVRGVPVIRHVVLHVLEEELGLPVTCGPTESRSLRKGVQTSSALEEASLNENYVLKNTLQGGDEQHFTNGTSPMPIRNDGDDMSSAVRVEMQESSSNNENGSVFAASLVARKPTNFGRLIVAKDALAAWLSRKQSTYLARSGPQSSTKDEKSQ